MKKKLLQWLGIALLLMLLNLPVLAAGPANAPQVSPNIPLDSYIYTYLEKLDGLGYLKAMLPDTKPYTRRQAAQWVSQIQQTVPEHLPAYARTMLERLIADLGPELAGLTVGPAVTSTCRVEAEWKTVYYDGATLDQYCTNSSYQPLNINNNGYRFEENFNNLITLQVAGGLGERFVFSVTPRFSYDEVNAATADLVSGYLKSGIGNLGIQLGKEAFWWGPGVRGSLPLTNNATPLTALKLSNLDPVQFDGLLGFLKQGDFTFFYSELDDEREFVKGPSFVGFRATFTPWANLTLGGSLNSIVGGEGHHLSGSDYLEFFTGKNADLPEEEKWNSIAGFDFRWRSPRLAGLQVYGEYYGEDQAGKFPPLPSHNAYLFGVKLPRLDREGRWELLLEKARTNNAWYRHWVYKEGYVYEDNILGDAMGCNGIRFYLKLSHYWTASSWMSFNAEHLVLNEAAAAPQKVNSYWLSYNRDLQKGLALKATVGWSEVDNLNYQANRSGHNFLGSVGLQKRF
ncbi:MAG TPA: capsule assembly Wzi family protein [Bacillota bacterium]